MSIEQSGEVQELTPAQQAEVLYRSALETYEAAAANLQVAEEAYRQTARELFAGKEVNVGYSSIRTHAGPTAETVSFGNNQVTRVTGVLFEKRTDWTLRKSIFLRVNPQNASGFWVGNLAEVEIIEPGAEA